MNGNEMIEKMQDKLDKKYCKFEKNYIVAKRNAYSKKSFDALNTALATSRDILAIKRFLGTLDIEIDVPEEDMGKKFSELLDLSRKYSSRCERGVYVG